MATATKTKAQGKKPKPPASRRKPPASVTNDPASWPTLEHHRRYTAAGARLDELVLQRSALEAEVGRLKDKHGELEAARLAQADIEPEAAALTSDAVATAKQTAKKPVASQRPEDVAQQLDAASRQLAIVNRAIDLQRQIFDREADAARDAIRAALSKEHWRRIDRVLGLADHLRAAVADCGEMSDWLDSQGIRWGSLADLDAGKLFAALGQWEDSLVERGLIDHDANELLAEAARIEAERPHPVDQDRQLCDIDVQRSRDQSALSVQNDASGKELVRIAQRAEAEKQALRDKWDAARNKMYALREQARDVMQSALADYIDGCAQRVTLDP